MVIEVNEDDGPFGVLGLSGAHEAPERRMGEVENILVRTRADGTAGDHHEPTFGQTLFREPGSQERESSVGGVVGSLGQLSRSRHPGDHDDIRWRLALDEQGLEYREVL